MTTLTEFLSTADADSGVALAAARKSAWSAPVEFAISNRIPNPPFSGRGLLKRFARWAVNLFERVF